MLSILVAAIVVCLGVLLCLSSGEGSLTGSAVDDGGDGPYSTVLKYLPALLFIAFIMVAVINIERCPEK